MPLDVLPSQGSAPPPVRRLPSSRSARGLGNYNAGLAAEERVARLYLARGMLVAARRWRGSGGEIDLILDDGSTQVFVEVKYSSSHDQAAGHVTTAQIGRLYRTADDYVEQRHGHQDIDRRFDLALVDGLGRIELIENAFML